MNKTSTATPTEASFTDATDVDFALGAIDEDVIDFNLLIAAVGCVGFVNNAFALLVTCTHKKLREMKGMVLVNNQCAVDMMAAFFTTVAYLIRFRYGRRISPFTGLAGEFFCRAYLTIPHWALAASSSYNLLAITTERYLMVIYPLYHKIAVTKTKLSLIIVLVWMIGPVYYLTFNVSTNYLSGNFCAFDWLSDNWRAFYGALTPLFQFFGPMSIMIGMYVRMILALRSKVHPVQPHGAGGAQSNMSRAHRNLTKMFLIVVICFIACWTSNQVYYFLMNIGLQFERHKTFSQISTTLAFANCCTNPFIYSFKYEEFRKGVRALIRRRGVASSFATSSTQEQIVSKHGRRTEDIEQQQQQQQQQQQ